MTRELALDVEGVPIERASADLAWVPVFSDERPLRGGAGRVDWRLCGGLSSLLATGRLRAEAGEAALVATFGGLRVPWLLVLGAGDRADWDVRRFEALAREAVARALALRVASLAFPLPDDPGGAVAQERRAAALLSGAAAAISEAEGDPALRVRVLVAPEEVTRTISLLRRVRVPRPADSVVLRLPGVPGAPRSRAPAVGEPPRGSLPIK